MAIDISPGIAVQCNELVHEVFAGLLPASWIALEVGEAMLGDWASRNFGLE